MKPENPDSEVFPSSAAFRNHVFNVPSASFARSSVTCARSGKDSSLSSACRSITWRWEPDFTRWDSIPAIAVIPIPALARTSGRSVYSSTTSPKGAESTTSDMGILMVTVRAQSQRDVLMGYPREAMVRHLVRLVHQQPRERRDGAGECLLLAAVGLVSPVEEPVREVRPRVEHVLVEALGDLLDVLAHDRQCGPDHGERGV